VPYKQLDASELLQCAHFRSSWQKLYERCPWSTIFQNPHFLDIWYDTYAAFYDPWVFCGYAADDELVGLLALTVSRDGCELRVAGTQHAEYQCWLADPEHSSVFIEQVFIYLRQHCSFKTLTFDCLPLGMPLESECFRKNMCIGEEMNQPLMELSDSRRISDSLKKKGNRSKLKRFEKNGKLQFRRINHSTELPPHFDDLVASYDLRIGALAGILPFQDDPCKKLFYLRMMDVPGILHATLQSAGERLISFHLGNTNGQQVCLGVLGYSPFFAESSPAKFHILALAGELKKEGFCALDLTPGGVYKERFATQYQKTLKLRVFFDRGRYLRSLVSKHSRTLVLKATMGFGISMASIQKGVATIRRFNPKYLFKHCVDFSGTRLRSNVYLFRRDVVTPAHQLNSLERDRIQHLCAFAAKQHIPNGERKYFFQDALKRLEAGQHCYTRVESGILVQLGWMTDQASIKLAVADGQFVLPERSCMLLGFRFHALFSSSNCFRDALLQMIFDAFRSDQTERVYCSIPETMSAYRNLVESLGGLPSGTLLETLSPATCWMENGALRHVPRKSLRVA